MGGGGLGGVSPRPKKMGGGDGGEEACLTQNLRGGALQGLLPDLLDGVEVHFCRLRQSCVERGTRPAPDASSMCPSPLLEASPSGRRECGGDASGSGVGVCERDGVPWAACVERGHRPEEGRGGGGVKKRGMGSPCGAGHRAAAPSTGPRPVSVWEGAGCRHLCVPRRAWAGVL